jgi:hypothetical protein
MHLSRLLFIAASFLLATSVAAQQGGFYVYQPKDKISILAADCPGLKPLKPGDKPQTVSCTFTDTTTTVKACAANQQCNSAVTNQEPGPGVVVFGRSTVSGYACCVAYDPTCGCYRTRCPCPY